MLQIHKKFEENRIKIKGGCQSYTKAAPRESWSDFTLSFFFKSQSTPIVLHMHKKFEVNRTKIKGGYQSYI